MAKNLILAGPKQVSLYDTQVVTVEDLGRNFYAKEEHVGKSTRAQASIADLKDLNPNVNVSIVENDSIEYMYFVCLTPVPLTSTAWWSWTTTIKITWWS